MQVKKQQLELDMEQTDWFQIGKGVHHRTFGLNLIGVTDFWEKLKKALFSVAGKICKHTYVLHFACNGGGFKDPLKYVHVRLRGLLVLKG